MDGSDDADDTDAKGSYEKSESEVASPPAMLSISQSIA
jgi:hypothetical protein